MQFDLKDCEIGDAIKISNINLPEGVNPTITDRDFVIATLVPPTVEVETKKEEDSETEDKEGSTDDKDKTDKTEDKKEDTEGKKTESKEESK